MNTPAKLALICGALLLLFVLGFSQFASDRSTELGPSEFLPESQEHAVPVALEATNQSKTKQEPTESDPIQLVSTEREVIATQRQEETVRGTVLNESGDRVMVFTLAARYRPSVKRGVKWQDFEFGPFHDGQFALKSLEPGHWRIQAKSKYHTGNKRESFKTPYKGEDLVLHLNRMALVQGVVLLPNQTPAFKATVILRSGGKERRATTDEQGQFEIDHMPDNFECLARHDIFASSVKVRGKSNVAGPTDLVLHLRGGGRLEGIALDSEGEPLVGWQIDVRSLAWELETRNGQTGTSGAFEFGHLSPGDYWVEATPDTSKESRLRAVRAVFSIISDQTTRVILGGHNPDAVKVFGTVFMNGEPAPDMVVVCKLDGTKSFGTTYQTKTDLEGKYEYTIPGSGPCSFLVGFAKGRLCPIPVTLTPELSQQVDLHIPDGTIAGKVVQTERKKKKTIKVRCIPEGRTPLHSYYLSRTVTCDEAGTFYFDHLPAGSYQIGVVDTMQADALINSVLLDVNGSVGGIELRTGNAARAVVLVKNSEGIPVADAEIFVLNHRGRMFSTHVNLRTSSRGTIKLRHLEFGEFRFLARKGDTCSPLSGSILINDEFGDPIDLTLEAGAHGVIKVTDSGQPIPARLRLINSSGDDFSPTLRSFDIAKYIKEGNNSSKYDVGPLPPGNYQVRARVLDGRTAKGVLKLTVGSPTTLILQL